MPRMPAALATLAALLLGAATVFSFSPFGASLLPALTLAGVFALWQRASSPGRAFALGLAFGLGLSGAGAHGRRMLAGAVAVAIVWASGYALTRVDWSHAVGEPATVSLVQGNIGQDLKFEPSYRE